MSAAGTQALTAVGWKLSDVDRLVAHQANARINAALAATLGLRQDAVLQNTAAASIPVLLAQAALSGTLKPGHRVLLAAFGGGLTWGAATLTWPELDIHDAIEVSSSQTAEDACMSC